MIIIKPKQIYKLKDIEFINLHPVFRDYSSSNCYKIKSRLKNPKTKSIEY